MRAFYVVLKAVSLLFGFIGGFIAFLGDVVKIVPQQASGLTDEQISLVGTSVFVISVFIFMLVSLLQDIARETSRPNIKALTVKPVWEPKEFAGGIWRDALSIEFKNLGGDAALFVSATIKWKSLKGETIPENHGRWHITNRKINLGEPLEYVDMLPNNLEHRLHFAIKSPDGKQMYAWYRLKDEQAAMVELSETPYRVEIVLTDSLRRAWKFKYLVQNEGTSMSASLNKKPKKTKVKKAVAKKVIRETRAPKISINSST